jgi:hypothetical protein
LPVDFSPSSMRHGYFQGNLAVLQKIDQYWWNNQLTLSVTARGKWLFTRYRFPPQGRLMR